jgi:hypothetical protein
MSGVTHTQTPVRQMLVRDQRRAKRVALASVTAFAALVVALVLFLGGGGDSQAPSIAQPAEPAAYGSFNPATGASRLQPPAGVRYDGGPEEGTAAIARSSAPAQRYDGGPDEGTRGPGR